jgi:hypothetical protein
MNSNHFDPHTVDAEVEIAIQKNRRDTCVRCGRHLCHIRYGIRFFCLSRPTSVACEKPFGCRTKPSSGRTWAVPIVATVHVRFMRNKMRRCASDGITIAVPSSRPNAVVSIADLPTNWERARTDRPATGQSAADRIETTGKHCEGGSFVSNKHRRWPHFSARHPG